ncbi:MAG: sigma-70 family RNA polymerase sigma factor [Deltaproteobacteria bacterium]|nr:sigma-70 family RNA polymerase sigma factor [Deltaproteobacteria bacterium]
MAQDADALQRAFAAACDRQSEVAASSTVGTKLLELVASADEGVPGLALDPVAFVQELGARMQPGEDVLAQLERLHAADLRLALACLEGDPRATRRFTERFGRDLRRLAHRFSSPQESVEDLEQTIHELLLVGRHEGGAKLRAYAGQGFLLNWLRITTTRLLMDHARRKDRARERPVSEGAVLGLPDPGDVELAFLKQSYRATFSEALLASARALDPGDRHLLRQHLVGCMSIDQIAGAYGIHRATAARRLGRARQRLLEGTRETMAGRLQLPANELDSVLELIRSQLDLSVGRFLASTGVLREAG